MKILGFFFECYVVVLMIKGSSAGQGRHVKQVDTWTGNSSLLWPRGVVHYFVADHNSADIKSIITGAIQTVLESFEGDCLQIQQLEFQPQRGHYIHLPYSDPEECSSDLGKQKNGPTYVELGLDCSTSDVALQLLVRALGAGQNDSRDWNEINAVLEKSSNLKAKFSMNSQYGHSVPGLVELGKMYNCTVKADIKEFYAILIEQQIFKVMENFDMCIDNMTEVGECKEDEQKLTSLVEELKNSASNSTDHHHKTQFKQALKFLTQREEMIKLKIDIKDLRENNEKLQQELDKQAEHDQKLSDQLELIRIMITNLLRVTALHKSGCDCQCSEHTYTDENGDLQGYCRGLWEGRRWCYLEKGYENCRDKVQSTSNPNLWWSYEACSSPTLFSRKCRESAPHPDPMTLVPGGGCDCQCNSDTYVDDTGVLQGNCNGLWNGKTWCYLKKEYENCRDRVKEENGDRFWSYEACSSPSLSDC